MKYLIGFLFIMVMIGCATKPQPILNKKSDDLNNTVKIKIEVKSEIKIESKVEIFDLVNFPQTSSAYLNNIDIKKANISQKNYEKNYFRVWNKIPKDSLNSAMWPFYSYRVGSSYGENFKLIDKSFFDLMLKNSNFNHYKSVNKNAITLNHLNVRAYPTKKSLFKDPSLAGEGFPFDYMQNSTVSANKPVFISHYSEDKEWAYIFTSFTGGWVKVDELIIIEKKYTSIWQKAEQVFLLKDNIAIYDENDTFLFKSRVGMMLPLVGEDKDNYIVLTVSSYKNSKANYHKTKISKSISHKGIVNFDNNNLKLVMDEVAKSTYGWGGLFNERDCSSTLRDIYTPFGIWLPRNSAQQSKIGKVISLNNLSDEDKLKIIKEKAIPFRTLLYKRGHILLYVGVYNDEVIAFHNIWGIRTKHESKEGRIVIAKAVYSTLNLGKNQKDYNNEASIIKNLKSFNILVN